MSHTPFMTMDHVWPSGANVVRWLETLSDKAVYPGVPLWNVYGAWDSKDWATDTRHYGYGQGGKAWGNFCPVNAKTAYNPNTHVYDFNHVATVQRNGWPDPYNTADGEVIWNIGEEIVWRANGKPGLVTNRQAPVGAPLIFLGPFLYSGLDLLKWGALPLGNTGTNRLKIAKTTWSWYVIGLQAFEKDYVWITSDQVNPPRNWLQPNIPFPMPSDYRWVKWPKSLLPAYKGFLTHLDRGNKELPGLITIPLASEENPNPEADYMPKDIRPYKVNVRV